MKRGKRQSGVENKQNNLMNGKKKNMELKNKILQSRGKN